VQALGSRYSIARDQQNVPGTKHLGSDNLLGMIELIYIMRIYGINMIEYINGIDIYRTDIISTHWLRL